jgi:N-methylhydantoinase B
LEANADVFLFGERGKVAPRGIVGGGDAATNRFVYEQADGEHTPPMVSKMVGIHITRGQKLRLETPGGGGYGNALDRPPEAVLADVTLGYVSAEVASDSYGVVIAADGTLDAGATAALRKERAA